MSSARVEIEAAGATLAADRWPGDGPTIVLLHAGVCDRRSWREVGSRLSAAGHEAVAYDRRGFGEVPPGAGSFRHVDDLIAVLESLSPAAPAWLVGSSMGGGVAVDGALSAPGRVAGLVLLAPTISGDVEPSDEAWGAATGGIADAIDAAWNAGELDACNRLEIRLWLDGPGGPEGRVGGDARELALAMNRIVIANEQDGGDGASELDAAGRLDELTIPVTVACGELDIDFKRRRSEELAAALPNGTYRSLPGRAHLPYLEAPDEVAALIRTAVGADEGRARAPRGG
jgi:pimeloyl-ACP methyl ester carboxylesterase